MEYMESDGCRIYVDIMTREKLSLRLVTRNSYIGQFVHPVGGDWVKGVEGGIRYFSPLRVTLY